ncbi:MAG: discoidin domain-containing protein, partial [Clostridiales Family XIII bacterium]|nr:discoidin domain-containing protein [Clostridiales Family XIII bacterium]
MNEFKRRALSPRAILLPWTLVIAMVVSLCGFSAPTYADPAEGSGDSLYEKFEDPPYLSKSRPLWFWNSNLSGITKEKIREIMVESKKSGYAGFGILPNVESSNYMSDTYLDLYEYALETAEELGMKMCLYDENWFPSGRAGDIIPNEYPEHMLKRLDMVEKDVTGPGEAVLALPKGPDRSYLGAVAMNTETKEIVDISDKAVFLTGNEPGVSASTEFENTTDYIAEKAFDGDYDTRWNAASSATTDQWLEVRFAAAQTVDRFIVRETFNRITSYAVQYFDESSESWKDLATGTAVGAYKDIAFPATTASKFRFFIPTVVPEGPLSASIAEIELYHGGTKLNITATGGKGSDHVAWDAPAGT